MEIRKISVITLSFITFIACCGDIEDSEPAQTENIIEDWRDQVIYQLMTDRFADGDVNNNYNVNKKSLTAYMGGDYQGIIDKLDYLEELGVTALWISPVVKNVEEDAGVSSYHGYWTQDFVSVNPHFGDLAKLKEMIKLAHERNIAVILDIVVNHIGQLFYYDINRNNSPDELLMGSGIDINGDGYADSNVTRITEWDPDFNPKGVQSSTSLGESGLAPVRWVYMPEKNRVPIMPVEFQNEDWYYRRGRVTNWNDQNQVETGDFPGGLKDIKTTNPATRKKLIEVMSYWVKELDIDGFRIDTLKHVEHGFWEEFCPAIRNYATSLGKEKFFMFGEAFDGDDAKIGSYTKNEEVDSVFYFSQKYSVIDPVFKYNQPTKKIEELFSARLPSLTGDKHYGTIAHPNGAGLPPWQLLVNFIDNHDIPRFLYKQGYDGEHATEEALKNALFYILTIDGIPCIYYGTEQGFNGGNDPANRKPLWESNYDTSNSLFTHIKHLTALRKKYEPLRRGVLSIRWSTDRTGSEQDAGIFAFERNSDGKKVLVVLNTSDTKRSETSATTLSGDEMTTTFSQGTVLVNVFEDEDGIDTFIVGEGGRVTVSVPPRGGKILVPENEVIE